MDSHERLVHFLRNVKPGDKVALWQGFRSRVPSIYTVEKVTKTQVALKDWPRRFSRQDGYQLGGPRDVWNGRSRIAEITAEDIRARRRARDIRFLDSLRYEDLSDDAVYKLAALARELVPKEQGSA